MNKIIFSCIIIFITIFVHNAYCASFDCSRAKSPIEKSICAIPKASKLDEELNVLYGKIMTKLDPKAQKFMYYEQMQWLQKLLKKENPREIIDTYKQRIAEIKQISQNYITTSQALLSQGDNLEGKQLQNNYNIYTVKNKNITYQQIVAKDEFSSKINNLVKKLVADSVKEVTVLDDLTVTIKQISNNIIKVKSCCNYSGGAYPDYTRECYYFNKQSGKLLTANDLFDFANINYMVSAMHVYINPNFDASSYDKRRFWPEIINVDSITNALKDIKNVSLDTKTLNLDMNLPHAIRVMGVFAISNNQIKPFMSEFLRSELKV